MCQKKYSQLAEKVNPKESSSYYLPTRYVLSFLTFWAMSLEYAHRVCLSVTIVAMVNHTSVPTPNVTQEEGDFCPTLQDDNATTLQDMGEYHWSPSVQGVILGSYFYGYICTQIIGGRMAELFGGKWLLGLSIFTASLLTLATPLAADIGVVAIVCLRVVMGLIHGICLPTVFAMFAQWAPEEERSTLVAVCLIGDNIGTVLSMPLAGYLCEHGFAGGWPSVFYVLGAFGCMWFGFWCCLAYNHPVDHPRISKQELDYIQHDRGDFSEKQKLPVPWKDVLTSMPVWSVAIVSFTASWGHTTLLTKLPTYLELVLHVPIQKNGIINSLIYVSTCLTLFFSGYLSDYLRSKKGLSPTKVRKSFQMFAMVGPAMCTALIPFVGCNTKAAIFLLTAAMAFLGLCGGGHMSIVVDMAPHHAGTIFGLVNGLGCSAGIFSPLIAGFLLDSGHEDIENWSLVFYISSAFYLLGAGIFLVFASAELQPWAVTPCTSKLDYLNESSNIVNFSKEIEASLKYGTIT